MLSTVPHNAYEFVLNKPLAPSTLSHKILAKYSLQAVLGKGASGTVWKAIQVHTNRPVAIKFMPRSKVPSSRLAIEKLADGSVYAVPMEVYILRRLKHRNIIRLLDYACDEHYFYIVTELHGASWSGTKKNEAVEMRAQTEAGTVSHESRHLKSKTALPALNQLKNNTSTTATDLFECLQSNGSLPEQVVLYVLAQLADVLAYLKHMNCFHLDIKDENIVIDSSYEIKLIDFGSAHILPPGSTTLQQFFGTVEYAPPELFKQSSYDVEPVEMWSTGTLMYMLLYGHPPFASSKDMVAGKFAPLRRPQMVSRESLAMLRRMLSYDPQRRMTIHELHQLLHNTNKACRKYAIIFIHSDTIETADFLRDDESAL